MRALWHYATQASTAHHSGAERKEDKEASPAKQKSCDEILCNAAMPTQDYAISHESWKEVPSNGKQLRDFKSDLEERVLKLCDAILCRSGRVFKCMKL